MRSLAASAQNSAWQEKKAKMKHSSGITIRLSRWFLVSAAVMIMLWNVWGFSSIYTNQNFVATEVQLWRQSNVLPQDWTIEDVDVWLGLKLQLDSRERAIFRSNKVDGRLLLRLTESDIRKDLRIGDNLMVKRLLIYLEDLKQGKGQGQAPMMSGQILLRNAHQGNASDFFMRMDDSNTKPRSLQLYRIWESMSGPACATLPINPAADTMAGVLRAALDAVRRGPGGPDVPPDAAARIVTRDGITVGDVRRLPAKAFVLLVRSGDNEHRSEYYFYPSDQIGERFHVPLLSAQRSVEVEVLSATPRLMVVRGLLSDADCAAIRKVAEPLMKPSTVLQQGDQSTNGEQQVQDSVRTSSTAWLMDRTVPVVASVRARVEELIRVPMEYAEDMQVLHYAYKQHYHVHHDYFDPALYPGDARWASGHNRMITVFFYLETVAEGGQTVFPYAGVSPDAHAAIHDYGACEDVDPRAIRVPAVRGDAVIFYGMTAQGQTKGELDKASLHGGCDPIRGDKWAANYWIRNGPVL